MRSPALSLVLLLGLPVTAAAQQPAPVTQPGQPDLSAQPLSLYVPPAQPGCSIADLHAQQGSTSQMLRTSDRRSMPVMRPILTLTPRDRRTVISATVTAHGYPETPGAVNLSAQASPSTSKKPRRQIAKTLTVNFRPARTGSYSAELLLPGFSAVTMIDLNSVTFGDGTTWRIANRTECRVAPDPLLLIAAD